MQLLLDAGAAKGKVDSVGTSALMLLGGLSDFDEFVACLDLRSAKKNGR